MNQTHQTTSPLEAEVSNPLAEIVALTQQLAIEPNKKETLLRRALVLLGMGQLDEAFADAKAALDQQEENWQAETVHICQRVARACYERGRLRHLSGDDKSSMEDVRRAMELAPELAKEITGHFDNSSTKK